MQSFLEEVADQSLKSTSRPEDLIYVLPSKRAGNFLRQIIASKLNHTVFSPKIYSIEDFVGHISGLQYASNTHLLFELYQAYLETGPKEADSFYDFCKWGQTLLQDFNEIDRYLVPVSKLFSYLADVKKLEQWTVSSELTPLMEGYIRFWNLLEPIYHRFGMKLLKAHQGYQGLVYRKACEALDDYLKASSANRHVFLGFNALNKAESDILQKILEKGNAEIYWDADNYYLDDIQHDAGFFIRQHKNKWNALSGHPLMGISNFLASSKDIQITGIPKNVSQMKYVGKLLGDLQDKKGVALQKTAVVLGDESLLNPLLHSIPEELNTVNITMGFPLQNTPLIALFSNLFELYLHPTSNGWFYKDVLAVLSHPFIEPLFSSGDLNQLYTLEEVIKTRNWIYVTPARLNSVSGVPSEALALLFFNQDPDPKSFITRCLELIESLKPYYQATGNAMALELLYRFYTLFNQLDDFVARYSFVSDLKTLYALFKSLVSTETVDFRGEPQEGLQIMGMLESRNLDFETVILTSVNEGILPSGKSNTSFIPFDIKREFGLPTYKEKDAVYSYHFYRLIQRAKNVIILYNTEPDVLEGGERSRLISQLLTDPLISPQIRHTSASTDINPLTVNPYRVDKDHTIMERLRARAKRGFSPSSLTNYLRNPIDFYKESILGIGETEEVDESITARIFGTVLHGALEAIYTPFIGQYLTKELLLVTRPGIKGIVKSQFEKAYPDSDIQKGKNLIAYNVLVRYMERLLELEISFIESNKVKIVGLEQELCATLQVQGLEFPIQIRGIIDRVDLVNDELRIIDYKTGSVAPGQIEVSDWEELSNNYDRSKAFQLLTYAYLYRATSQADRLHAGIISLKSLNSGVMYFATKDKEAKSKNRQITPEVLEIFRGSLDTLLLEIFNPDLPFLEKPV